MRHELMILDWSQWWLALHELEEFDSRLALIKGWRMDQECISEEIPSKG
jgi:hypothetical protein